MKTFPSSLTLSHTDTLTHTQTHTHTQAAEEEKTLAERVIYNPILP